MISSPKVGRVQLTDVDLEEFTWVHPKNDWHMLETARVKKSLPKEIMFKIRLYQQNIARGTTDPWVDRWHNF